jgi:major membrane immunogen (membrane-anchored lipoprotein)
MNYKDFGILILTTIIVFMLLKSCNDDGRYKELNLKYEEASKAKDSLGRTITVKDAEIVNNQQSMQDLRAKLFETTEKYNKKVKEVKALIAQGTEVVIKDRDVPYLDSAKMKQWEDSVAALCGEVIHYYEDSTVKIGSNAKDSTAYYKIDATIGKNSLKINEIKFIDSQYVSVTEFKGGFFKRNTKGKLRFYEPRRTKVEIKHTNPHFENKNIDAFFYKKKRTFDTHSFLGGGVIGVSIGILLMALL